LWERWIKLTVGIKILNGHISVLVVAVVRTLIKQCAIFTGQKHPS